MLPNNKVQSNQADAVNVKKFLSSMLDKWYYFAISIIICLAIAFFKIKYSNPIYKIKASILIKDENKAGGLEDFLEGTQLFQGEKNLENEIGIISSRSMIRRTLVQLEASGVSYFKKGKFRDIECYHKKIPYKITVDSTHRQIVNVPISLRIINDKEYEIEVNFEKGYLVNPIAPDDDQQLLEGISIKQKGFFNQTLVNDYFKFTINLKTAIADKEEQLYFKINNIEDQVDYYKGSLTAIPINKKASIVEVSLFGTVIEKEVDFLNTLINVYIDYGLEEKNQVASNTINFIDNQLTNVRDSLKIAEEDLQLFRTGNNLLDVTSSTKTLLEKATLLENEKSIINLKFKYYNYLKNYLESNLDINKIVAPSAIGIDDLLLNNLINELAKLNGEKISLQLNSNESNPYTNVLQQRIKHVKETLLENLKNIVNTSQISLSDVTDRVALVEREINKLPVKERKLVGIQRRFSLNDNIYNYLLQKRAESGIAKAANTADNRIVDGARLVSKLPTYPPKSIFYLGALIIGLALPFIGFMIYDYWHDTISDKADVEKITNIPIIGTIGHIDGSQKTIAEIPKSSIAESFRTVRINLQYLATELPKKVIGVTSSVSGEGKTFFSANLAIISSLTDKKVLLIAGDLRKPTVQNYFNFNTNVGISSFLINKSSYNEIIQNSGIPNLDIIGPGPIPPNPSELLNSAKLKDLFVELKKEYDYIIIECSPVGIVSDYYSFLDHIDINLFITRANFTSRESIQKLSELYNREQFKNLCIVINDVQQIAKNYGYGYTDDSSIRKKGFLNRFF